jgi:hypothetical protein
MVKRKKWWFIDQYFLHTRITLCLGSIKFNFDQQFLYIRLTSTV